MGGFGSAVLEVLAAHAVDVPTRCLGVPDRLVEHGQTTQTLGLDAAGIAAATRSLVGQAESS